MSARRRTLEVGAFSLRFPPRAARAGGFVLLAIVAAALAGLLIGDYDMTFTETIRAALLLGDDPLAEYFVRDVRLPRVVTALVVGAALGIAGCLFQNVTGNPLGSPDVIGFTTGAATGALVQIIVAGASTHAVGVGALIGGFATAAIVLGLARSSGLDGGRLVLVGIGVGAALGAVNSLLMVRASLVAAQTAAQWLAGSLNAVLWPRATLVIVAVAVLSIPALLLARPLGMLALGDDTCSSAGIPVRRVRTGAVLTGVALVSVATAATGPIAFVALAAPQLARRLAGVPTPGVVGSALMGALLVQVSDLVAQRLFAPDELAVGVVTGAVGGIYLIILLAGEWRRNHV
ncbi:FecCD family ABC transporter permease [Nocardioides alcanivorans]|uniref:FecCD family ABC transporter permease n=1 Tax=Nocardioides alcanivorans TaxID=2897352 RepID=UPI001F39BEFF|nr:iron chelate uptake ABC transporter family permease subunit [Nocardioides alcanivorans]